MSMNLLWPSCTTLILLGVDVFIIVLMLTIDLHQKTKLFQAPQTPTIKLLLQVTQPLYLHNQHHQCNYGLQLMTTYSTFKLSRLPELSHQLIPALISCSMGNPMCWCLFLQPTFALIIRGLASTVYSLAQLQTPIPLLAIDTCNSYSFAWETPKCWAPLHMFHPDFFYDVVKTILVKIYTLLFPYKSICCKLNIFTHLNFALDTVYGMLHLLLLPQKLHVSKCISPKLFTSCLCLDSTTPALSTFAVHTGGCILLLIYVTNSWCLDTVTVPPSWPTSSTAMYHYLAQAEEKTTTTSTTSTFTRFSTREPINSKATTTEKYTLPLFMNLKRDLQLKPFLTSTLWLPYCILHTQDTPASFFYSFMILCCSSPHWTLHYGCSYGSREGISWPSPAPYCVHQKTLC